MDVFEAIFILILSSFILWRLTKELRKFHKESEEVVILQEPSQPPSYCEDNRIEDITSIEEEEQENGRIVIVHLHQEAEIEISNIEEQRNHPEEDSENSSYKNNTQPSCPTED
jgi:hypothetical protein